MTPKLSSAPFRQLRRMETPLACIFSDCFFFEETVICKNKAANTDKPFLSLCSLLLIREPYLGRKGTVFHSMRRWFLRVPKKFFKGEPTGGALGRGRDGRQTARASASRAGASGGIEVGGIYVSRQLFVGELQGPLWLIFYPPSFCHC